MNSGFPSPAIAKSGSASPVLIATIFLSVPFSINGRNALIEYTTPKTLTSRLACISSFNTSDSAGEEKDDGARKDIDEVLYAPFMIKTSRPCGRRGAAREAAEVRDGADIMSPGRMCTLVMLSAERRASTEDGVRASPMTVLAGSLERCLSHAYWRKELC